MDATEYRWGDNAKSTAELYSPMGRRTNLDMQIGPVAIPLIGIQEKESDIYIYARFNHMGLVLSLHGSGRVHLHDKTDDFYVGTRLPPKPSLHELRYLGDALVEELMMDWEPNSDTFVIHSPSPLEAPYVSRSSRGSIFDVCRFLRSWQGGFPFQAVREGRLEEYLDKKGVSPLLVFPRDESVVAVPGPNGGYAAFPFEHGTWSLGLLGFASFLEAFPIDEALGHLIERGAERLQEYEEMGVGIGAQFEERLTEESLDAVAKEITAAVSGWRVSRPRFRYP